jgi:hypothetical protein
VPPFTTSSFNHPVLLLPGTVWGGNSAITGKKQCYSNELPGFLSALVGRATPALQLLFLEI